MLYRRSTTVPHVGNWRNKFFNERKGKYQTENKVIEKKNYKNRQKEMLDMIHSGKIRIDINPEKQNRHCKNHRLFEESKSKAIKNNYMLPNYTTIPNRELNKLLMEKSNTGIMLLVNNKFNKKEIIDFGVVIGKAFVNGRYINTKLGKYIILRQVHM